MINTDSLLFQGTLALIERNMRYLFPSYTYRNNTETFERNYRSYRPQSTVVKLVTACLALSNGLDPFTEEQVESVPKADRSIKAMGFMEAIREVFCISMACVAPPIQSTPTCLINLDRELDAAVTSCASPLGHIEPLSMPRLKRLETVEIVDSHLTRGINMNSHAHQAVVQPHLGSEAFQEQPISGQTVSDSSPAMLALPSDTEDEQWFDTDGDGPAAADLMARPVTPAVGEERPWPQAWDGAQAGQSDVLGSHRPSTTEPDETGADKPRFSDDPVQAPLNQSPPGDLHICTPPPSAPCTPASTVRGFVLRPSAHVRSSSAAWGSVGDAKQANDAPWLMHTNGLDVGSPVSPEYVAASSASAEPYEGDFYLSVMKVWDQNIGNRRHNGVSTEEDGYGQQHEGHEEATVGSFNEISAHLENFSGTPANVKEDTQSLAKTHSHPLGVPCAATTAEIQRYLDAFRQPMGMTEYRFYLFVTANYPRTISAVDPLQLFFVLGTSDPCQKLLLAKSQAILESGVACAATAEEFQRSISYPRSITGNNAPKTIASSQRCLAEKLSEYIRDNKPDALWLALRNFSVLQELSQAESGQFFRQIWQCEGVHSKEGKQAISNLAKLADIKSVLSMATRHPTYLPRIVWALCCRLWSWLFQGFSPQPESSSTFLREHATQDKKACL